jgi:hypothetical protein
VRWLLVVVVVASFGGSAHAFRPRMEPRITRECPKAASWSALLDCFKAHQLVGTVIGTVEDAKLVSVTLANTEHALEGIAVYIHAGDTWRLGGLVGAGDPPDFNLLRFEHVGRGYRIDFASTLSSSMSFDGVTSVPALFREITATFCNGASYRCIQVTPHCEQIVHGQTVTVFDGTLTVRDNRLSLKGVGSQPSCGVNVEEMFW